MSFINKKDNKLSKSLQLFHVSRENSLWRYVCLYSCNSTFGKSMFGFHVWKRLFSSYALRMREAFVSSNGLHI